MPNFIFRQQDYIYIRVSIADEFLTHPQALAGNVLGYKRSTELVVPHTYLALECPLRTSGVITKAPLPAPSRSPCTLGRL